MVWSSGTIIPIYVRNSGEIGFSRRADGQFGRRGRRRRGVYFPEANDTERMEEPNDRIGRVELEPFPGEVGIVRAFVVVVLEKFSHHQEVQREAILAMVVVVEIGIAIFMTAPVDNCSMNGAHKIMDGEQEKHPPLGGIDGIERGIAYAKGNAGDP